MSTQTKIFELVNRAPDASHQVLKTVSSVAEIVDERVPKYGARTVIRYDNGFTYESVGGDEYQENIRRFIGFLNSESASRKVVATLTKNRPEWDMAALASLYTANILSPLDTKMNDDELRHLLKNNPPDYFVVSVKHIERVRKLLDELGQKPTVLAADLYPVFEDLEDTETHSVARERDPDVGLARCAGCIRD